jgi:hypothetical protein
MLLQAGVPKALPSITTNPNPSRTAVTRTAVVEALKTGSISNLSVVSSS